MSPRNGVLRLLTTDRLLLLLVTVVGCSSSPATPVSPADLSSNSAITQQTTTPQSADTNTEPVGSSRAKEEFWEAVFLEGTKVGHSQTVVERLQEADQSFVSITNTSAIKMQRFGQTVQMKIRIMSIETPSGEMVRFETEQSQGPVRFLTKGRVSNGELRIETITPGSTQRDSIPWEASYGGLFADRGTLQRDPLEPGETRQIQALVPIANQLGTIQLSAKKQESTDLLEGSAELLRVETSLQFAGTTMPSVLWVDSDGAVQKSSTSISGIVQTTYRTSREISISNEAGSPFDLGKRSVVKVDRKLEDPHATARATYRARLPDGNPAEALVSDGSQTVEAAAEQVATIVVTAVRPGGPVPTGGQPPTDLDLSPNNLIQCEDSRILALSQQVAPGEPDRWKLACALETYVHQAVKSKSFTQALASAADVARSLEGDCTEHAVLLAALCRARQIPARVAIGLVYFPPAQAFAYHMWNEVWIEDRWVPLDATLGRCGIGAAHIKINTSNLNGVSAVSALLPVLELLGQLELEIVTVERTSGDC
jgi:hypothetical protein